MVESKEDKSQDTVEFKDKVDKTVEEENKKL
jgi:hypothetical protein